MISPPRPATPRLSPGKDGREEGCSSTLYRARSVVLHIQWRCSATQFPVAGQASWPIGAPECAVRALRLPGIFQRMPAKSRSAGQLSLCKRSLCEAAHDCHGHMGGAASTKGQPTSRYAPSPVRGSAVTWLRHVYGSLGVSIWFSVLWPVFRSRLWARFGSKPTPGVVISVPGLGRGPRGKGGR